MEEAVMSVVMLKYGIQRSYHKKEICIKFRLILEYDVYIIVNNSLYCAVASANQLNLNLFVLEDSTNAGVK